MLGSPDFVEVSPKPSRVNLLEDINDLRPEIAIPADQLGADKWTEMVQFTQADGKERGLVVGSRSREIVSSKIFKGDEKKVDTLNMPFAPYGLMRTMLPGLRHIVFAHSHPIPPELSHLRTSPMSDGDIRTFANAEYKAMVMVDRGGVHVLLKNPQSKQADQLPTSNMLDAALVKAKEGGNTITDVVRELAISLEPHGVKYYFSPSFNKTPDGLINLQDARNLRAQQ